MREMFPNFEAVRHAVAHAAEFDEDDLVKGPYKKGDLVVDEGHTLAARNCFMGYESRTYINTFEGEIQTYDLSLGTLEGLNTVRMAFNAAFLRPASETVSRAMAAQPSPPEPS